MVGRGGLKIPHHATDCFNLFIICALNFRVTIWRRGVVINYVRTKFGDYNQFTQYSVGKRREQTEQEGLAVASIREMIPPLKFPAMTPSLMPARTATAMRGKLGSEFET